MTSYCIKIVEEAFMKPETLDALGKFLDEEHEAKLNAQKRLAEELGCSEDCAGDVEYLRTRNRHTSELEAELIRLHAAGTPPNLMDFGVTKATQQALLKSMAE